MLVEIPDPQIILSVIVAFVIGVLGMIIYGKIKAFSSQKGADPAYVSRLEYYERQLIDMKIRLDALDLEETTPPEPVVQSVKAVIEERREELVEKEPVKPASKPRMPNMDFNGIVEHVLGLITAKEMTSRDIQITIGRSREHTSRLMKRLFEEGLVERNTRQKPFTYKITDKGKAKVGGLEAAITA